MLRKIAVEYHDKGHGKEVNAEIFHCFVQYLGRSPHPRKYRASHQYSQYEQEYATDYGYHTYGVDGIAYTPVVLLTDVVGNDGTCSHRDAEEKIDKQAYYRSITSYSCQCLTADEVAYYGDID